MSELLFTVMNSVPGAFEASSSDSSSVYPNEVWIAPGLPAETVLADTNLLAPEMRR